MIFSRFISTVLTICVIATSGAVASMRVDTGTGQFVTICAGGQSVTVELDATGAPLETRHHCPDCTALAIIASPVAIQKPVPNVSLLIGSATSVSQRTTHVPKASARAPPVLI